jgi:hypothetical protein
MLKLKYKVHPEIWREKDKNMKGVMSWLIFVKIIMMMRNVLIP